MVSLTCVYSKRKNNNLLSAETLLTKYEVITSMSVDGFERWICTLTPETQAGGYSIIGSIKLEETKTIYLGVRTRMPHSAFSRERQVKWPSTWIDYRKFHPLLSASCPHRRSIRVVVECFGEDSWHFFRAREVSWGGYSAVNLLRTYGKREHGCRVPVS